MSYVTTIKSVPFESLSNAADFVRKKYNLDRSRILSEEFEQEFGLKVHTTDDYILSFEDEIEFPSEQHYLLFIMRWS